MTSRISVSAAGVQAEVDSGGSSISAEGRFVVFTSSSDALIPGDANGAHDVFVNDRLTGAVELVSVAPNGSSGNGESIQGVISANGRFVAFRSDATDLVPGDTNGFSDVFLRDRIAGTTVRVSTGAGGVQADGPSSSNGIAADGRHVVFTSAASNLVAGDTNGLADVFVRDLSMGITRRASVSSGGAQGDEVSRYGSLSAHGRHVAFLSTATNLVPGDANATQDVFVHDFLTGTTERVNLGAGGAQASAHSYVSDPSISADGRFVVFASYADGLVPNDANGKADVFVRDRLAGVTELISVGLSGQASDQDSSYPAISADGQFVAFRSASSDIVPGDADFLEDLFIRDRAQGSTELLNVDSLGAKANPLGNAFSLGLSEHGEQVLFTASSGALVPGDLNGTLDAFVRDRASCPLPARYCEAKTNSAGCVPGIAVSGSPSLSGPDDLHVSAQNVLNRQAGLLIFGRAGQSAPFAGGVLCVAAPQRTPVQLAGGSAPPVVDCSGQYDLHLTHAFLAANGLGAGEVLFAQYWSRDPGFPNSGNVGLTRGVQILLCP